MQESSRRRFLARSAGVAAGLAASASGLSPARPRLQEVDAGGERPGRTTKTQFAVNVEMWWSSLPFLDRLRAAADLGFPAVEFWPWRGKDIEAIGQLARDLRLEISQFTAWGFSPGLNDPVHHAAFAQEIEASCAVAKELGVGKMCVVGGDDIPGVTQAAMHAAITAGLARVAPLVEEAGVTLILEPMNIRVDHKGHCLYGSPAAVGICRAVDSLHVKINWDLYHMHISEGDLCGHLREGFDQVGYLQVADHPGRHEPGTGEVHYQRVLKEAWDLGYRGFVGLECSPLEGELAAARRCAAAAEWE